MTEPAKWLSNLWIIEKESGVCIFEQGFMEITTDPDLISGFLIAMLNFGKELNDNEIQAIQFDNLKIHFKSGDKYIMAIAVTGTASIIDVDNFLDLMTKEFEDKYSNKLIEWDNNISDFTEFGTYIEQIVNKKALSIELLKSAVLKVRDDKEEQYRSFIKMHYNRLTSFIDESKKQLLRRKDERKDVVINRLNKIRSGIHERIKDISKKD